MNRITITIIFSMLGCFTLIALEPLRKAHFNLKNGNAIEEYDTEAYFKLNKAVKGSNNISNCYRRAAYFFMSTENKEDFKKIASKYEPEYGGWCAYVMGASGEKVVIDPNTFKLVNGKLYLY